MDPALHELIEAGAPEDEVAAVIRLHPDMSPPPQVRLVAMFGTIATCRLRRGEIVTVRAHPSVASLKAPRQYAAEGYDPEDYAEGAVPGFNAGDYKGRGVVVGVVDWGIDIAHPNFRNPDGSTRLLACWDQRPRGHAEAGPYGYGVIHSRNDINRALQSGKPYRALRYHPSSSDPGGSGSHGTHVLDIAAGRGAAGSPGLAPAADLLFVHMAGPVGTASLPIGDSVGLLEAVYFIFQTAGGRPCVINLSMGRHAGSHDGLTLVEQSFDFLVSDRPNRAIVQSAGNYFDRPIHVGGKLSNGERHTFGWHTDREDTTPNEVDIWYAGSDRMRFTIATPDGSRTWDTPLGGSTKLDLGGRTIGNVYHRRDDPNNHDNQIQVFLYPGAPGGEWSITMHAERVVDGRFHAWVERDAACFRCQSRFEASEAIATTTTGTICNGKLTIAVGAYDPMHPDRSLAKFSSSGPTRDGRRKPDLLAPGVRVEAARSAPREATTNKGLLTVKSGTSMAAPHVAGTIACMFEAAGVPLTIGDTRRLLLTTTDAVPTDAEPGLLARSGAGYLNVEAAIRAASEFRPSKESEVMEMHECGCGGHRAEEDVEIDAEQEFEDEASLLGCAAEEFAELDEFAESEPEPADPVTAALSTLLTVSPHSLFHTFVSPSDPGVLTAVQSGFDLLARPGAPLQMTPEPGDILVRHGDGSMAHAAVIAANNATPLPHLLSTGFAAEGYMPGNYIHVVEAGPFPHAREDRFARRLTDSLGRMPRDQMLVRPRFESIATESQPDVERVKWLQRSLNQLLGLNLAIDGIAGNLTTAALRRFQQQQGLRADGVLGQQTERRIRELLGGGTPVTPVTRGREPDFDVRCPRPGTLLDRFLKDSSVLTPDHRPILRTLADRIVASQSEPNPVHFVCLIGHTDSSGGEKYNYDLGRRRAEAAKTALAAEVEARSPGLSHRSVVYETSSMGETAPVAGNTTPEGQARNRRVEIYFNNRWLGGDGRVTAHATFVGAPAREVEWIEQVVNRSRLLVLRVGATGTGTGSGTPLPPGTPGHTWSSANTSVVTAANRGGDTQTTPNLADITGVAVGLADITFTYRASTGATATDSFPVRVVNNGGTAPDSSVATSFVAAHRNRFCVPGQASSSTCRNLANPRLIQRIVIHTLALGSGTPSSMAATMIGAWPNAPQAGRESAPHYVIDRAGTVTQVVREDDVAFHAGRDNPDTIGIEHSDICNDPEPYNDAQYLASASLVRDIGRRHRITLDATTVVSHSQLDPTRRGDPGPYWDWDFYLALLAWDGTTATTRPVRLVAKVHDLAATPAGWSTQRRRTIPQDNCASTNDPWGATYRTSSPNATGAGIDLTFNVTVAGEYSVSCWWASETGANTATPVRVVITCAATPCADAATVNVTANQTTNSGRWNSLTTIRVTAPPVTVTVTIGRNSTAAGVIIADAVRLLKTR